MKTDEIHHLFTLAEDAVSRVASTLKNDWSRLNTVTRNQGKDIKLGADISADEMLLTLLKPTGIGLLSEETGSHGANCMDGLCWIVDPLDGTLNYHRGYPACAVSVALWDQGKPVFGVIHDIYSGKKYSGMMGASARCGDEMIRVSNVDTQSQAILATGFPSGRNYADDSLHSFVRSVQAYKKIRMIGSAALSLANVAAGVFDIYQEQDIRLWDVAAGLALVLVAGGRITTSAIRQDWKMDVTAWNGNFELELA